jgi:Photosynthesis system II assembly factor YCF48
MNPRDNDREFGAMLRRGLASGPAAPESDCFDASQLAAYYERTLTAEEIRACDLHVSNCAHCRSQLAALARAEPERVASGSRPLSWLWDWRLLVPVTAALTIFVAWVTVRKPFEAQKTASVAPMVAQSQAPAAAAQSALPPASQAVELSSAESAQAKKSEATASPRAKSTDSLSTVERRSDADANKRLADEKSLAKPRKDSDAETKKKVPATPERTRGGSGVGAAHGEAAGGAYAQAAPPASAPLPTPPSANETVEVQSGQVNGSAQTAPPAAAPAAAAPAPHKATTTQTAPAARTFGGAAGGKVAGSGEGVSAPKAAPQAEAVTSRFKQDESKPIVIPTPDASIFWRVAGSDEIQFSRDVGATWQAQLTEPELRLAAGIAPTPKICWIVGSGGAVLRTEDGETWQRVKSPTPKDLVSVVAQDANVATITASDGATFTTKNGGRSWKKGKKSR